LSKEKFQNILKEIDDCLEGRVKSDHTGYSIAGRRIDKIPVLELVQLRKHYVELLSNEEKKEKVKAGKNPYIVRTVI
jgi:hypothetical protein